MCKHWITMGTRKVNVTRWRHSEFLAIEPWVTCVNGFLFLVLVILFILNVCSWCLLAAMRIIQNMRFILAKFGFIDTPVPDGNSNVYVFSTSSRLWSKWFYYEINYEGGFLHALVKPECYAKSLMAIWFMRRLEYNLHFNDLSHYVNVTNDNFIKIWANWFRLESFVQFKERIDYVAIAFRDFCSDSCHNKRTYSYLIYLKLERKHTHLLLVLFTNKNFQISNIALPLVVIIVASYRAQCISVNSISFQIYALKQQPITSVARPELSKLLQCAHRSIEPVKSSESDIIFYQRWPTIDWFCSRVEIQVGRSNSGRY